MASVGSFDVVVVGGGIAGLWTLARLRQRGFNAILLEKHALGGVQSIASQGIIHGGTKYALGGRLGDSAKAIGDMPRIWSECLQGSGELDLSAAQVLTSSQLLWSGENALSRVAGFFAGKMMQDRMQSLKASQFPAPFDHAAFKGSVYQLNEPVLDTASLMHSFYQQFGEFCFQTELLQGSTPNRLRCLDRHKQIIEIETKKLVLTAGKASANILQMLGYTLPAMQLRPVHMVMLKGDLPELYAHCLGASANPKVTITSSRIDGQICWYVGGGIAESGIHRDRSQQIKVAKQELAEVLSWLDFSNVEWATVMLDRAEVETAGNKRPESSFVEQQGDLITVWPTKLAFAPKSASQVLALLDEPAEDKLIYSEMNHYFAQPPLARPPWFDTDWSA